MAEQIVAPHATSGASGHPRADGSADECGTANAKVISGLFCQLAPRCQPQSKHPLNLWRLRPAKRRASWPRASALEADDQRIAEKVFETGSPSRVRSAESASGLVSSATKWTEPSPSTTFAPPG